MPFDLNKYKNKTNYNPIRLIRFYFNCYLHSVWKKRKEHYLLHHDYSLDNSSSIKFNKNNFETGYLALKKILPILFKIILWLLPLIIASIFYSDYYAKIPFSIILGAYIVWTIQYFQAKQEIKDCKLYTEFDNLEGEYYKRYIQMYNYNSTFIALFIIIFLTMNYLSILQYILILFFILYANMWYKRYVNIAIKLDLIFDKNKYNE